MSSERSRRPALPLVVSGALLLLVVTAAVLPNLGLVAAQSNCTYGACTQSSPPNYNLYYAVLAILVVVALAMGVLLLMRRRRTPPSPGPLTEAEPAGGGPSGPDGPEMVDDSAAMAAPAFAAPAAAGAAVGVAAPAAAGAAYLEGPEDVGAAPPAAGAPAPVPPAASEGGEDIDSLMQELDKISGEILKRPPVKKDGSSGGSSADDEGADSS